MVTKEELKTILEKHKKWLMGEDGGEKADLSYSNLSGSDLSGSDLRGSDLRGSDLSGSDLRYSDLSGSDLSGSNLSGSDLRGSDLSYSNLDFSSGFSFRCSSFGAIIDLRIGAQMAYHFCRMKTEDPEVKSAQEAIKVLANKFHRVDECGKIE